MARTRHNGLQILKHNHTFAASFAHQHQVNTLRRSARTRGHVRHLPACASFWVIIFVFLPIITKSLSLRLEKHGTAARGFGSKYSYKLTLAVYINSKLWKIADNKSPGKPWRRHRSDLGGVFEIGRPQGRGGRAQDFDGQRGR